MADYEELKSQGMQYIANRRTNYETMISQDDMKRLDSLKSKIISGPLITLGLFLGWRFLPESLRPPKFLDNPLASETENVTTKRMFRKPLSNQLTLICTFGAFSYFFVRYEVAKYYMYLKYENLVDAYVDARNATYAKSLQSQERE
mmetsp:Transcript_5578/g.6030  ORF Transcript_5578/g.6030 Transcript_5578/m.6030 type:complete len:146 (-) Transcript_5578:34-471(-)